MRLPEKYQEEMRQLLGSDYPAYEASLFSPVYHGLRTNPLKITKNQWDNLHPFDLEQVPWIENGYYYAKDDNPSKHPYYYAGLYYIQEPSAMTPANRLPVKPGDLVLDLCAAPGGKATELGGKLQGQGLLWANDISNSRAKALLKNLEMQGIGNCCVTSEEPARLAEELPEFFDKILIDAPCSGEGMFHREPSMIGYWEEHGPDYYVPIQRDLLSKAASMLKPGGMMLYSTCTFSIHENEENIQWILAQCPDLSLEPVDPYDGFQRGYGHLTDCVRIFPFKMKGEGHFLALLKKAGTYSDRNKKEKPNTMKIPKEVSEFLKSIHRSELQERLYLKNDKLYQLPACGSIPGKLRYLRTGLFLGSLEKNRFEPSQALAMNLKSSEFAHCIHFSCNDDRVIRYLKGETLQIEDKIESIAKGWYLVCVEDYPLGWGKIGNGRLKNKYSAGWRMQ